MIQPPVVELSKLDSLFEQDKKEKRKERILAHQIKKEWEWLCKQDENLPSYIRSNLENMPNNKGYIWKGIWYFGHQPEEDKRNLIMFERQGKDLFVHEICHYKYHRVFKRQKDGENTLISEIIY